MNLAGARGELRGTAVVRDKDGKVKQTFTFGGPATAEQAAQISKATGVPLKISGEKDVGDSDHNRA
jgi:hypothetical protein